ncbi:MAG: amidohydrolase, partial [Lachnospiraceae bacterium]|nr:amidohydrolase [Lachnospiraceae bacterium]
ADIKTIPSGLKTGVIALIAGGKEGEDRMLRADIDALPVTEDTGLEYMSKNRDVMHACGHDFHTVCALAAAVCLNERRDELSGNVYVVFQPGEEAFYGSRTVLETHVLDNVRKFYGFHCDPTKDVGVICVRDGAVTASVDRFMITVNGTAGHGAVPHKANNPIPVIVSIAQQINTFSGGMISAFSPHVITITEISAKSAWNVIPESAKLTGTVRTMDEDARKIIRSQIGRIAGEFGEMYDVETVTEYEAGSHVTWNDSKLCNHAKSIARKCNLAIEEHESEMTGDDFGDYAPYGSEKSGVYIRVGTGKSYPLHHPKFMIDPAAIEPVTDFLVSLFL